MGGNKPHKSRFASKGEQTKKTKGRVHLLKGPARGGVKLSAAGNASGHNRGFFLSLPLGGVVFFCLFFLPFFEIEPKFDNQNMALPECP